MTAATDRNRDIRAWARSNGIDIADTGKISTDVRTAFDEAHAPTLPRGLSLLAPDEAVYGSGSEQFGSGSEQVPTPAGPPVSDPLPVPVPVSRETLPVAPAKRRFWGKGGAPQDPAQPRVRSERAGRKRASLEAVGAFAWRLLAQAATRRGLVPTGRILQMQAPVAGVLIDDGLKGSLADRILQPFARAGEKGEMAFALLGPPLLVTIISQRPDLQDELLPLLVDAMESWVDIAGPKLKAENAKREKRIEEMGESGIMEMINQIFAPPEGMNAAA